MERVVVQIANKYNRIKNTIAKLQQKKTNKNSAFVTATIYIQFSLESSSFLKAKFGLPTNLVPDVRIIYCAQ